jgi:hypothetical protein
VNISETPAKIYVRNTTSGHDGQFFYRFALNPFTNQEKEFGITVDNIRYRHQRILYPLLTWLLSLGGRPTLVPISLLLVNFLSICIMAVVSGIYLKELGKPVMLGLIFTLYPGFLYSITHSLAEIVEITLLISAILCLHKGKQLTGAILISLGILAKETLILLPVSLFLIWLMGNRKYKAFTWAIPFIIFSTWQVILWLNWGQVINNQTLINIGFPMVGALFYLFLASTRVNQTPDIFAVLFIGSFFEWVRRALPKFDGMAFIRTAWWLYIILLVVLSPSVWNSSTDVLRAFSETYVFGASILLPSLKNYKILLLGIFIMWMIIAIDLVVFRTL